MKTHPWSEIRTQLQADPVRWERIQAGARALGTVLVLAALRDRRGISQTDVAVALDMSQARVSRIEHQEDIYHSTLRDFVAALGGRLEVRAIFPDEAIDLVESDSGGARGSTPALTKQTGLKAR